MAEGNIITNNNNNTRTMELVLFWNNNNNNNNHNNSIGMDYNCDCYWNRIISKESFCEQEGVTTSVLALKH